MKDCRGLVLGFLRGCYSRSFDYGSCVVLKFMELFRSTMGLVSALDGNPLPLILNAPTPHIKYSQYKSTTHSYIGSI